MPLRFKLFKFNKNNKITIITFNRYWSAIMLQYFKLENIKLLGIVICSVHVLDACASMPCNCNLASSEKLVFV